jgi:hypothetical protein
MRDINQIISIIAIIILMAPNSGLSLNFSKCEKINSQHGYLYEYDIKDYSPELFVFVSDASQGEISPCYTGLHFTLQPTSIYAVPQNGGPNQTILRQSWRQLVNNNLIGLRISSQCAYLVHLPIRQRLC